jgi:hypothetical protein
VRAFDPQIATLEWYLRKYSEDQPRDELGRFGETGGDSSSSTEESGPADSTGHTISVGDMVDIIDPVPNTVAYEGSVLSVDAGRNEVEVWLRGGIVATYASEDVRVQTGEHATINPEDARALAERGGFSFQPFTASLPSGGFMVAGISEPVTVAVKNTNEAANAIVKYVDEHAADFDRDPNLYIGGWVSGGEITIELAENVADRAEAAALGEGRNQIAIFDIANGEEIGTGGTGEFRGTSMPLDVYVAVIESLLHDAGFKYSEDQPRDELGRFGETGGGETSTETGTDAGTVPAAESYAAREPGGSNDGRDADHPYVTRDVDEAAKALAEGKFVDLTQAASPSTLLDKLAEMGNAARAAGEKAPAIDLARATIQGTNIFMAGNMGVPRVEMPQFIAKAGDLVAGSPAAEMVANGTLIVDAKGEVNLTGLFAEHLREALGIQTTEGTRPAGYLRATQSEIDGVKVGGMMGAMDSGKLDRSSMAPVLTTKDDYVLDGHHQWAATVGLEYKTPEDDTLEVRTITFDAPITDVLREAQTWTLDMGSPTREFGKRRDEMLALYNAVLDSLADFKYSEDQPRDELGRFGEGGGGGSSEAPTHEAIPGGQYYHGLSEGAQRFVNDTLGKFGVDRDAVRTEIVDRIKSNPDAVAAGKEWYAKAHDLAGGLDKLTGGKVPFATASAVTAVLSPQTNWAMNAETSARMAQFFADGKTEGMTPEQATVAFREAWQSEKWGGVGKDGEPRANLCLPDNVVKGFALLAGPPPTPDETLGSNKVRSFDNNILTGGKEPPPDVTVDVHMGKAFGFASGLDRAATEKLMGTKSTTAERTYANGRHVEDTRVASVGYTAMASIVREASEQLNLSPAQAQAAYWIAVRDESPAGWTPPRAGWSIDTPLADSIIGENLGGTKARSDDVLSVDEAAGEWDDTDWWTEEQFQREYDRQVAELERKQ